MPSWPHGTARIIGGDGGDQLAGGGGNDTLLGSAGIDLLLGDAGNDTLDGGADIDTLQGGAGDDTYLNVRSEDVIDDTEGNNTIQLASANGLATSNALSMANSTTLKVALDNGETLTLQNAPFGMNATLQFANGDVLDLETLVGTTLATPLYLALDDSGGRLYGGAGADALYGGAGNDTLSGGNGNDQLFGRDGDNVLLGGRGADVLVGLGGKDLLDGGLGDDSLTGGAGDDILRGGQGKDTLQGDAGADIYEFGLGSGPDTIYNYDADAVGVNADTILLGEGITPSDIVFNREVDDLILSIKGTADSLRIVSYFYQSGISSLAADSVEIIRFADGTVLDATAVMARTLAPTLGNDTLTGYATPDSIMGSDGDDILYGEAGNDTLEGGSGFDTLYGGEGADTLQGQSGDDRLYGDAGNDILIGGAGYDDLIGGAGADTYLFGLGSGEDYIDNYDTDTLGTNPDTIQLGAGLTPGNITLTTTQSSSAILENLTISVKNTQDSLIVRGYFSQDGASKSGVEYIRFNDGTTWDYATTKSKLFVPPASVVVYGTSANDTLLGGLGNDTLWGRDGNDSLNGGGGNDTLIGEGGSDTYYFGRGSGNDALTINNNFVGELDTILLGTDVLPADVVLVRGDYDYDLFLYIKNTSDSLRIGDFFNRFNLVPGQIKFANGTIWDVEAVKALMLAQTPSIENDSLYGLAGVDTINGFAGNDRIFGYAGNDTLDGGTGEDHLYGDEGDDILMGGTQYDRLDGGIGDDLLLGQDGNDFLQGRDGRDTLDGGNGNDALEGDDGGDTYLFGRGSGQDTITDNAYNRFANGVWILSAPDTLLLGPGLVTSDIGLVRDSDALVLSILGTDDNIRIERYFYEDGYSAQAFETIKFSDGTVWSIAEVKAKVLAGSSDNDVLIGYASDDTLSSLAGNDIIYGGAGNDTLDGGVGYDRLYGGGGDDTYLVESTYDYVSENLNEGMDTILSSINWRLDPNIENLTLTGITSINATGNTLDNFLLGNGANNFLLGDAGNDRLDGMGGADTLIGGLGNDTYVVGNLNDVVTETSTLVTEIDSVESSVTYTLGLNVENLTLTGTAAINGTGNALGNILRGNRGYNILSGLEGNDTLYAGDGDEAYGGAGNDTLIAENTLDWAYLNGEDGNDTLTGSGAGSGSYSGGLGDDTITGGAGYNYIWGDNIDGGTTGGIDTIYGGADIDYAWGGFDNDTLYGNGGDDTLSGQQGDDKLYGGIGNDTLIGGLGNDLHVGDLGDDTYTVDNASDIVTENLNEGTDTIRTSATRTLDANVENLTLTGTAAINGTGNALGNILRGNRGYNILSGLEGNDTLYAGDGDEAYGGAGNDTLIAENTLDWAYLNGEDGNDTLTGSGAGSGSYSGGLGDDTITGGAGYNYIWGDNIDGGTTGGIDTIYGGADIDYAWGGFDNDTLYGNGGDDTLSGQQGDDKLYGGLGNDTLIGGLGNDLHVGGLGDDTYTVDNASDIVTENLNEGTDTIRTSATRTLDANVENLTLTGTAAINGTGNALGNILTGNSANNTLTGGAGNDTLDGGSGADQLSGGIGNDTYLIDNFGDTISELANAGIDTIRSSITHTLGANLENLTLTGTAAINGTGNALDNRLAGNSAANVLTGGAGNDVYVIDSMADSITENANEGLSDRVELTLNADYTLGTHLENVSRYGTGNWQTTGNASANHLYGNGGNDTLIGLGGNDLLWGGGGAGSDTLVGGSGNDTYYIYSLSDIVTEVADQGVDLVYVWSSIAHTLAANVENGMRMFIAGSLTGNTLDNSLEGSWDNDTLDGGAGADTLKGNGGTDTLMGGTGNDTYVLDRDHGVDTVIEIDATAGNTDIAQFLSGVATDQIWFQKIGNNLETSIIGTADKLVIQDWYTDTANHIEQFKTADGKILLDSQVQNLVNAMASFTPPAAGQTTLPPAYQTDLAPVIAENWQ